LEAQVGEYDFTSNEDQVVAVSAIFGGDGAFAFTSSTAIGSWFQVSDGQEFTTNFIAQTDWNINPFPPLDPTLGNIYQIQTQYLGFGGIEYYIENPASAGLVLVHRIPFANTSLFPSVNNPSFRIGWLAFNDGNTSDIQLSGGSAAGFVEGQLVLTDAPRAIDATAEAVGIVGDTNLITIRNRLAMTTKRNRVEVFGLTLTAVTESVKGAFVQVRTNADIAGELNYQYIDKASSVVEQAMENGLVTGGRLVATTITTQAGTFINLEELSALILPGDTLTVSVRTVSGGAADATVSLIWQEDL